MPILDTSPPVGQVRELRLGLVCYGGVSLAIYMHGITAELHRLVVASRAFEADPATNPFPATGTEHHYWNVLAAARRRDGGVTTRVVLDTISGNSAGGINGIVLAKALAHDLSQDELRRLWMERADRRQLVGGNVKTAFRGLGLLAGTVLPGLKAKPPLDGDAMYGWLVEAFEGMKPREGPAQAGSLLPDGHELRLFVTTTDFYGYGRRIPIHDPTEIREKRHRHVMEFRYGRGSGEGRDDFDASHDAALAFAARATSSFPGAFPPIELGDIDRNLKRSGREAVGLEEIVAHLFREYELEGADPSKTHFVDGGVLDNAPFSYTIRAIVERTAGVEVDRRLLYVQPDPRFEPPRPESEEPGWGKTIWGGLSTISGYEPILDDLLEVRAFNDRVRRIREMVGRVEEQVGRLLEEAMPGLDLDRELPADVPRERLRELRDRVHEKAREAAGYLYDSYFQVKVHSVVEQFGRVVARLCGYPPDSTQADLVARVAQCWGESEGLLGEAAEPEARRARQLEFLQAFDLGYTWRRVRFVIQAVNEMYGDAGSDGGRPDRADLDRAKRALYDEALKLSGVISGVALSQGVRDRVTACFGADRLPTREPRLAGTLDELARELCERHRADLDAIEGLLREEVQAELERFRGDLYETFRTLTADWNPEARRRVVVRYLGFPFWDALIYPLRRLSDVGELDPVEVVRISPSDARALAEPGTSADELVERKLKGIGKGHFAAFLERWYRENDFLWGRLDAVERLTALILGSKEASGQGLKQVLAAVVEEELGLATERKAKKVMRGLRKTIAKL